MRIAKNIKSVTDIIPKNVKLVAVSKTKSINKIVGLIKYQNTDYSLPLRGIAPQPELKTEVLTPSTSLSKESVPGTRRFML